MDEIERLKLERAEAYRNLIRSSSLMKRAKPLFDSINSRYLHDKMKWESLDHQLAILDGRLKIEPPSSHARGKSKEVEEYDFTPEQIEKLARECGVILPDVEDEPPEAIDDLE